MSQNPDSEQQDASGRQVASAAEVINKELLEKALKKADGQENLVVTDFSVSKAATFGDGFMSIVCSVQVQAQIGCENKTVSVIAKILPENPVLKDLALNTGMFEKEVGFYDSILPTLVKFQENRQVTPRLPSVPKFFYGFEDNDNNLGVVIMEDLRDLGYKLVNKREGFDYDHCQLVVKELANLHALSFAWKTENSNFMEGDFGLLLKETFFSDEMVAAFKFEEEIRTALNKALGYFYSATTDENAKTKAKVIFDKMETEIYHNVIKKYLTLPTEPYGVICHGDAWGNNMMFRYEGSSSKPVQVKLLDLQTTRYALPTTDLSLFFFTSALSSVRKQHLDDLLKLYHETFTEMLSHVNAPYPDFTYEVFHQMFLNTAIYGAVLACDYLYWILADSDAVKTLETCNTSDQMVDHMQEMSSKASVAVQTLMKERVGSIIEDYVTLIA